MQCFVAVLDLHRAVGAAELSVQRPFDSMRKLEFHMTCLEGVEDYIHYGKVSNTDATAKHQKVILITAEEEL